MAGRKNSTVHRAHDTCGFWKVLCVHVRVQMPPCKRKLRAEEVRSDTLVQMMPLWGRTKHLSNMKVAVPRTAYLCNVPYCLQSSHVSVVLILSF